MELIQTVTVGSGGASGMLFSSIPQTFDDIRVVWSGRSTLNTFPIFEGRLKLNTVDSNQTSRYLRGLAGVGIESVAYSYIVSGVMPQSGNTSNTFNSSQIYIPNYRGSTNKSVSVDMVSESNNTATYSWDLQIIAGLWSVTDAITSLEIYVPSGLLAEGSTASLYGITKGSDGIVTTS
jgi:hypothetical protein